MRQLWEAMHDVVLGIGIGLIFALALIGACLSAILYSIDRHGHEVRIVPTPSTTEGER